MTIEGPKDSIQPKDLDILDHNSSTIEPEKPKSEKGKDDGDSLD